MSDHDTGIRVTTALLRQRAEDLGHAISMLEGFLLTVPDEKISNPDQWNATATFSQRQYLYERVVGPMERTRNWIVNLICLANGADEKALLNGLPTEGGDSVPRSTLTGLELPKDFYDEL